MKRFNFHISNKGRLIVVVVTLALAGGAMFYETYNDLLFNANTGQPAGQPVTGGTNNQSIKIVEAHWQGMEAVPLTWELAAKLNIPLDEKGVLVDEVTLASADSGLRGGDVIKSLNGVRVTDLNEFYNATKRLKNQKAAFVEVKRGNKLMTFDLLVPDELGFAQLEAAPMILPGSIAPHRYRGPCTDCHAIGSTGHITPDPDFVTLVPPPISKKAQCPHRYRGECNLCHVIR